MLYGGIAVLLVIIVILGKRYLKVLKALTRIKLRFKLKERENEILQKQRDNNITTVDDADRVWDDLDKRED